MLKFDEYIEQDMILEMARVGFMGQYEIYVHTDDPGYVPHVHIRDTATKGHKFETCVKLKSNEYFLHGKYTDTMNSTMRKNFAEFMESRCVIDRYDTNYELAVDMWNLNNSKESVVIPRDENGDIIIPNYRTIKKVSNENLELL